MKCRYCRNEISERWQYCPKCGANLGLSSLKIDEHIKRIDEMIKSFSRDMGKNADKEFEVFDIKPMMRSHGNSGFSFSLEQRTGEKPKVKIQTFGNIKKKEVEKEIKKFVPGIMEEKKQKIVGVSEPKTNIRSYGGKVKAEMELPGVHESDIKITQLQESIEVFASSGKKGYFKIISIPAGSKIIDKEFKKDKLVLEIM